MKKFTVFSIVVAGAAFLTNVTLGAEQPESTAGTVKSKSNITNNKQSGGSLSAQDKDFVMKAAKGHMMEVAWGNYASTTAKSPDVQKFGKRMETDHIKAYKDLVSITKRKGMDVKEDKPRVVWKGDRDYMDMMVDDHAKDLAEFNAEAKNGSDPDIKKYAADTAKVVSRHLQLAKQARSTIPE